MTEKSYLTYKYNITESTKTHYINNKTKIMFFTII